MLSTASETTSPSREGTPALARPWLFAAFQAATARAWGHDAAAQCLQYLSRGALLRSVLAYEDWLPERYALEWFVAVWNGPAARSYPRYAKWVRCLVRLQVGRVGRSVVWLAGPRRMLAHAPSAWRRDHSSGELTVQLVARDRAVVTLRDHPYLGAPLAHVGLADYLVHALTLARAEHAQLAGLTATAKKLEISLCWRER